MRAVPGDSGPARCITRRRLLTVLVQGVAAVGTICVALPVAAQDQDTASSSETASSVNPVDVVDNAGDGMSTDESSLATSPPARPPGSEYALDDLHRRTDELVLNPMPPRVRDAAFDEEIAGIRDRLKELARVLVRAGRGDVYDQVLRMSETIRNKRTYFGSADTENTDWVFSMPVVRSTMDMPMKPALKASMAAISYDATQTPRRPWVFLILHQAALIGDITDEILANLLIESAVVDSAAIDMNKKLKDVAGPQRAQAARAVKEGEATPEVLYPVYLNAFESLASFVQSHPEPYYSSGIVDTGSVARFVRNWNYCNSLPDDGSRHSAKMKIVIGYTGSIKKSL